MTSTNQHHHDPPADKLGTQSPSREAIDPPDDLRPQTLPRQGQQVLFSVCLWFIRFVKWQKLQKKMIKFSKFPTSSPQCRLPSVLLVVLSVPPPPWFDGLAVGNSLAPVGTLLCYWNRDTESESGGKFWPLDLPGQTWTLLGGNQDLQPCSKLKFQH